MKKSNGLKDFLRNNAWAIILVVMGWIVGFALLQQQVNVLATKVAEYPSQDWFELKFETIDKRFDTLEQKVD